MWVNTEDLPTSDGHPFFARLNRILEESGFDAFVEGLCEAFYACRLGRPSLRPGRYFRLSLLRKACSAEFCLRRRGERGQRTGRSVRRMAVTATVAGEPETRGFMEPACR